MYSGSWAKIVDNTGIKTVQILRVLSKKKGQIKAGDMVLCIIKKINQNNRYKLKKGQIIKGLVVMIKQKLYRKPEDFFIKLYQNTIIILNQYLLPRGSILKGAVSREIIWKGHLQIASIAPRVI